MFKKEIVFDIGQIYKHYKILDYDFSTGKTKYKCECQKCGTIVYRNAYCLHHETLSKCRTCTDNDFVNEIIGKTFGCITVISKNSNGKTPANTRYNCKCSCGNELILNRLAITNRVHLCCKKCRYKFISENRYSFKKHGIHGTPLYQVWRGMNLRCFCNQDKAYKNYGGRGITVCYEWSKFNPEGVVNFYNWSINNGYKKEILSNGKNKWSLDRINNDGNYEPDNCRWTTQDVQANNKRNNINIEHNGKTQTLKQWAKELNIKYCSLLNRYERGVDVEKCFSKKDLRIRITEFHGKKFTSTELAKYIGCGISTLNANRQRGTSLEYLYKKFETKRQKLTN